MTEPLSENTSRACGGPGFDRIVDYLSGALPAEEERQIAAHLGECPSCRRLCDETADIVGALHETGDDAGDVPVPEEVDRRVLAAARDVARELRPVPAPARRSSAPLLVGAAAACLLALVSGLLWGRHMAFSSAASVPPDLRVQLRADLQKKIQKLETDRAEEVALLREQIRRQTAHAGLLAKTLTASESRIAGLIEKVAEVAGRMEEQKTKTEDLEAKVRAAQARATAVARDLSLREASLAECRRLIENERRRVADLEDRLGGAGKTMAGMQETIEALRAAARTPGDFNGDGRADVTDALAICSGVLRGRDIRYTELADLNRDGKIDVGDALLITGLSFSETGK
jgi:hypothetical protein